jgi:uncharacterized protein
MHEVEIPELHCYRCGNTWSPRIRFVRICPRCKSPYWDEPKLRIPTRGGGLGVQDVLAPYRTRIQRIARRYRVREIRVFGSVALGAANRHSDVDLLVEFDRSRKVKSALRTIDLALELETLLGRHVDVATESSLPWFIQPQVVTEAIPL